jgi:hypothetical protein
MIQYLKEQLLMVNEINIKYISCSLYTNTVYCDCIGISESNDGKYEGTYDRKGRRHGHGSLTFPDGTILTGTFLKNTLHGDASISFKNSYRIITKFYKNYRTGNVKITHPSGSYYEGALVNNERDGNVISYQHKLDMSMHINQHMLLSLCFI